MNLGSGVVLEGFERWMKGQRIPGRVELGRGLSFDPVSEDSGLVSFVGVQGICEEDE